MFRGEANGSITILSVPNGNPFCIKKQPELTDCKKGGMPMYTEYSFIGIVEGQPMEFVSEAEYLEYISE